MTNLVEVKILDYLIVLSCDETTTVAEITASAVAEVQTFNLRNFPRKVLHTRDSSGRILSGSLKLIQNNLELKLEVVIATYSSNDALGPKETLSLFREWQFWTANQVQEAVKTLSIQDLPSHPDPNTTSLLYELCKAPVEKVQLMCTKTLQILLTKFPQRDLVIQAAEQICKVFISTAFANVAVAALECFKGLSPLQAKVFNGTKYVREMYNVQHTLARFTEDKQSMLFEAFQSISAILGDRELMKVIGPGNTDSDTLSAPLPTAHNRAVSFVDSILSEGAIGEPRIEDNTNVVERRAPPLPLPTPMAGASVKRINLKRLESLLSSEDRRVREYALQKLFKLLTHASKLHKADAAAAAVAVAGAGDEGSDAVNRVPEQQSVTARAAGSPWDSRDSSSRGSVLDSCDGDPQFHPDSAYKFSFQDGKEVESLIKCLFRCLKACIHARPKASRVPAPSSTDHNRDPDSAIKSSPEKAGGRGGEAGERGRSTVTSASTAGRLVQTALGSPQSDEAAVLLVVDCLWQVLFFAQDVPRDAHFPLGLHRGGACRQTLRLTGAALSNIQLVFASAAREWYRLLLTLSHADEGSKLLRFADLAEKAAFFFIIVVLHGMEGGWRESELSLEASAICAFLSPAQPTFRSYLALTFLTSLSARCFPGSEDSRGNGPHSQQQLQLRGEATLDSQALQDILMCRNFEASASLWRWGTMPERARRSALMSLTCLSSFCAFSHFTSFMIKLDPITKLAAMLQVAVRDEEVEGREYGILAATSAGTSTLTSKEAVPDSPEDDDWDAPRDRTRIPVTAPPDEAEMGPPELTFDGAFGGSPRAGGIDGNMFVLHNAAQDKLSAFDRLMGRNAGARAGAKDTSVYVYPDIPLIRLILKTMSNLLSAARSSGAYSEEYRGELASWLREVEIGPAGEGSSKIRFMRLVRRDETVAFYFNMIANT